VEALALADRVAILDEGKVQQSGAIAEVFARPASLAVARAVGIETIEPARVVAAGAPATVAVGKALLSVIAPPAVTAEAHVCIRAEDVILERETGKGSNRLPATVRALDREGPLVRVALDCGFPLVALVTGQAAGELGLREGQQVTAVLPEEAIVLLPRDRASAKI
jgi:molybdate transport system ATP-binding protein